MSGMSKLFPVYPFDNPASPTYGFFVSPTISPPWTIKFDNNDNLRRKEHFTNFLKPCRIQNYLALCRPHYVNFDLYIDIDPGSISVKNIIIEIETSGEIKYGFLEISNKEFNVTSVGILGGNGIAVLYKSKTNNFPLHDYNNAYIKEFDYHMFDIEICVTFDKRFRTMVLNSDIKNYASCDDSQAQIKVIGFELGVRTTNLKLGR